PPRSGVLYVSGDVPEGLRRRSGHRSLHRPGRRSYEPCGRYRLRPHRPKSEAAMTPDGSRYLTVSGSPAEAVAGVEPTPSLREGVPVARVAVRTKSEAPHLVASGNSSPILAGLAHRLGSHRALALASAFLLVVAGAGLLAPLLVAHPPAAFA